MQPAASRQYTANIPLPAKLNVSHGCPSHNGGKFKLQFQNYCTVRRLDKEPIAFQSTVFLPTVWEDAMDVFIGVKLEQADMKDFEMSAKHTKSMDRTALASNITNHQKQLKLTSPLCVNWQRTVTLEFLRTD